MSKKETTVTINGKEYISSGRAAELVGYTKDYVGQLARSGKIDATRIGRSWYISEESIRKHKLSSHYTLTKPKKKRKDEKLYAKKTSKNITNSSTNLSSRKKRESFSKVDDDLIPRIQPKRKSHDVLLHTDISYERHTVKENISSDKDSSDVAHDGFKMVAIRKPQKPRTVSLKKPNRHKKKNVDLPVQKSVRVDGIVKKKKRHVSSVTDYGKKPVTEDVLGVDTNDRFDVSTDDGKDSKILKFVFFIIFITILLVAYIFIFVG